MILFSTDKIWLGLYWKTSFLLATSLAAFFRILTNVPLHFTVPKSFSLGSSNKRLNVRSFTVSSLDCAVKKLWIVESVIFQLHSLYFFGLKLKFIYIHRHVVYENKSLKFSHLNNRTLRASHWLASCKFLQWPNWETKIGKFKIGCWHVMNLFFLLTLCHC